jgi:hypothetical protein
MKVQWQVTPFSINNRGAVKFKILRYHCSQIGLPSMAFRNALAATLATEPPVAFGLPQEPSAMPG